MKKLAAALVIAVIAGNGAAFAQNAGRCDWMGNTPAVVKKVDDANKLSDYLQEHKYAITETDVVGFTALHYAADAGNIEAVVLLVENHADVNAKTQYGDTPVYRAARAGHFFVVDYLASKGAKVDTLIERDGKKVSAFADILNICSKHNTYTYKKVRAVYIAAKAKEDAIKKALQNKVPNVELVKKLNAARPK